MQLHSAESGTNYLYEHKNEEKSQVILKTVI